MKELAFFAVDWQTKPGGVGLNKGLPFVHKQMVLYFYRQGETKKLLDILPQIMQSRFLMPIHYVILAHCDREKGITSRPKELSLEYGIEWSVAALSMIFCAPITIPEALLFVSHLCNNTECLLFLSSVTRCSKNYVYHCSSTR